jgi:eukaryotic-like serine/threonine-protein kinase
MSNLALVYQAQGRLEEAKALEAAALELRKKTLGLEHLQTLRSMGYLGRILLQRGEFAAAEPLLRQFLAVRAKTAPTQWQTCSVRSQLGEALTALKRFAEAEPLLVDGYEGLKRQEPKIPAYYKSDLARAGARLIALYTAWEKTDETKAWRRKLAETGNSH